ncbi:MAG: hypothetical protein DRQ55_01230 [Planctomycetota bacterium]|nr:MAG: hypothetical protein DRQ55_01230 [Planctomycetota bacterium]
MLVCGLALSGACAGCPPAWADALQVERDFTWAASSAGPVFVEADGTRLALTRAARRLADHLGLDVERRLSVLLLDGTLYVEAVGADGIHHELDGLELVDQVLCDGRVHVRVRLAAAPPPEPEPEPASEPETAPPR